MKWRLLRPPISTLIQWLRSGLRRSGSRSLASAKMIAHSLGGKQAGCAWTACCPAHDDRQPSLSISDAPDGKVLVHCHAGCEQHQVIAALRSRGLWNGTVQPSLSACQSPVALNDEARCIRVQRIETALSLWEAAAPADHASIEAYLAARGIYLPAPRTLRFYAQLKHPSQSRWPGMLALVTCGEGDTALAVHRTFLNGEGGKAPVEPSKMMLGPCRGGAVRLAPPGDVLLVGEGIETCL